MTTTTAETSDAPDAPTAAAPGDPRRFTAAKLLRSHGPLIAIAVLALVLLGIVGTVWLRPLMDIGYSVINTLISPLLSALQ